MCVGEGGRRAGGELSVKTLEGPRGGGAGIHGCRETAPRPDRHTLPSGSSGSEGGNGLCSTDYLLRPRGQKPLEDRCCRLTWMESLSCQAARIVWRIGSLGRVGVERNQEIFVNRLFGG